MEIRSKEIEALTRVVIKENSSLSTKLMLVKMGRKITLRSENVPELIVGLWKKSRIKIRTNHQRNVV